MKNILFCMSLCLISAGIAAGDGFYDTGIVNSIEITFEEDNWDEILDRLYAEGDDRLIGSVVINGAHFDSVGVKYKGNSSYNSRQIKNPLNIKLDQVNGHGRRRPLEDRYS